MKYVKHVLVMKEMINIGSHKKVKHVLKSDFYSHPSSVTSEIVRTGPAQICETNRIGSFALFAFEVQIFQLCEIFLQQNHSDFYLNSLGVFTAIKNF